MNNDDDVSIFRQPTVPVHGTGIGTVLVPVPDVQVVKSYEFGHFRRCSTHFYTTYTRLGSRTRSVRKKAKSDDDNSSLMRRDEVRGHRLLYVHEYYCPVQHGR